MRDKMRKETPIETFLMGNDETASREQSRQCRNSNRKVEHGKEYPTRAHASAPGGLFRALLCRQHAGRPKGVAGRHFRARARRLSKYSQSLSSHAGGSGERSRKENGSRQGKCRANFRLITGGSIMPRKVAVKKSQLWKAIRLHCLACCGDSPGEVSACESRACSLWAYRRGRTEPPRGNGEIQSSMRADSALETTIEEAAAIGTGAS